MLAIESLNVAGMDQLPHQAKAIRDAAAAACCRRSVTRQTGTELIVAADRFYPSKALLRLWRSQCGFGAGTALDLPTVRPATRSQRKCRAQSANKSAARELGKLALGPVGPNVTLLDGKALANGSNASGETGPGEGRTAWSTPTSPAVDGGAAPYGGSRSEVVINTQLQLAI